MKLNEVYGHTPEPPLVEDIKLNPKFIPPSCTFHHIDLVETNKYSKIWTEYKSKLNIFLKKSPLNYLIPWSNIWKLRAELSRYELIDYESFKLNENDGFKQDLINIIQASSTLRILKGMKDINSIKDNPCIPNNDKAIIIKWLNDNNKDHLSCVMILGIK